MEYSPLHSLCESITDCPHSTPEWTTSGKIVIRNQNIKDGKLDLSNPSFTTAHDFQRRITRAKPASGDIIITREAPMGEACLVPDGLECCLGQRMVLLKPDNKKCNNKYLLYAILSRYVQHQISWSSGTGTTVSNLRIPHLENLSIPCPDRCIQDSIAATLSCLDDKIELNNRIIANLEAQAQAIFKSWFVDFEPFQDGEFEESELGSIPKGWRVGTLDDVCTNITDGVHNTVIDDLNGQYYLLSCKNLKSGTIELSANERRISKATFEQLRKRTKLAKGDVLITSVGTVGEIALLMEEPTNIEFQRSVAILKPDPDFVNSQYLYCNLKANKEVIRNRAHGAVQQCIFIGDFKEFEILIPKKETLVQYCFATQASFDSIKTYRNENTVLEQIRDTLLPKLMSGEIEVPVEG